jgi:RNA polymerase sigma-70 factor (TIGR02943 family)
VIIFIFAGSIIKMENAAKQKTLRTWVDKYSDTLFAHALFKTSIQEVAEDLVQDTFLSAYKGFEHFEGKSSPKTWLFSILNHKILDYYRKLYKEPKASDNAGMELFFDDNGRWKKNEIPDSWNEEPGHLLDDADFNVVLQRCLGFLPPVWHTAVHLKYLEEKKGDQICQELEITPTNLWQIIHRAKLQLRKCVEDNWFKKV